MNTRSPNSFEVQNTENQEKDNNSIEAKVANMRYLDSCIEKHIKKTLFSSKPTERRRKRYKIAKN